MRPKPSPPAAFAVVVALKEVQASLLVLAALNVLGALSMAFTINRTEGSASPSAGAANEDGGFEGINDCNPLGM